MLVENLSIISDQEKLEVKSEVVNDAVRLEMMLHVFHSTEESLIHRHIMILGKGKAREIMEALKQALEDEYK